MKQNKVRNGHHQILIDQPEAPHILALVMILREWFAGY
jgi:hypothetical protein